MNEDYLNEKIIQRLDQLGSVDPKRANIERAVLTSDEFKNLVIRYQLTDEQIPVAINIVGDDSIFAAGGIYMNSNTIHEDFSHGQSSAQELIRSIHRLVKSAAIKISGREK